MNNEQTQTSSVGGGGGSSGKGGRRNCGEGRGGLGSGGNT